MNKIIVSLTTLFFLHGSCISMHTKNTEQSLKAHDEKTKALIAVGHQYMRFLDEFGQNNLSHYLLPQMKKLFSPNIKKINALSDAHAAIEEM